MRRLYISYLLLVYIGYISAQVIENPVFDRTDVPAFRVQKIEIQKDTTYIYCTFSAAAASWANISKDMYLYAKKTNNKYPILRCEGLPFSPQKKTFINDTRCDVLLCFPPIRNISKIDLIEKESETAFNIYCIDIASQYETIYQESDITHFSNMASFYESAGDTIKALHYKLKETEAVKYIYGIKSETLSFSLTNAYIMCDKFGYYKQAIDLAIQDNIIVSELRGKSNRDYATSLSTIGMFYSHAKEYEKAIESYKESIHLFESLNIIDNEYVLALFQIASNYYKIDDTNNALLYQRKSLAARRQIGDAEGYIDELNNVLLVGSSNAIQMLKMELDSLPSFVEPNSLLLIGIYKEMARQYSFIGNYTNAIDYCNKAISVMNSTGHDKSEDYAELLGLKCKYQAYSRQYNESILSGEMAKQIFDSLDIKSIKYAELLGDLAGVYGNKQNYEESVQLQLTAAGIYKNSKDWMSLSSVYGDISNYYQFAEKLDDAEMYINKAIEVISDHDSAEQYINDEVERIGNDQIDYSASMPIIQQTINIHKSNFYNSLARIYIKQGKYTDAINTQLKSVKYAQETSDNEMYASSLSELSEYYSRNNQHSEAILCSEHSVQLTSGKDRISLLTKLQLSCNCLRAGDMMKAISYALEVIAASNSSGDIESKIAAQTILSYSYWKNQQFSNAERCLSEELNYLKSLLDHELRGMTTEQKQRLWNNYEHNFRLYRNIIEKSDRNDDLLSKLYDYVLFSKNLLLDSQIQNDAGEILRLNIKWKDIQQQLSNDAIAIEFIYTKEVEEDYRTYHALVIDNKSSSPRMITLYDEFKLEKIKETDTRSIRDIVGELIWKPILNQYTTVKDIYFSPDGILHMIPIEYYSADGMNSMFENHNMYRLSSTKELIRKKEDLQHKSAVLYGGLDYNYFQENISEVNVSDMSNIWRGIVDRGGFESLFNTALETQEIKDLLTGKNISTTLYNGEVGTEESFRNLSGQRQSIIHLATHGMYIYPENIETKKNENNFDFLESLTNINDPVKEDITLTHSFLVMSGGNRVISRNTVYDKFNDGILTSKEISQLDLRGLDLVVLSACETALGDINSNGVYGLQRGFKKAGANTILMSLGKVDDEATRILMVEFYRNLTNGKTKQQSLKNAQKHLRQVENGKYDDPKYWASFIMLDGLN